MSHTIRSLTLDDFDALSALMREIQAHHVAGVPRVFKRPEGPVIPREEIEERHANPQHILLAAFEADQMIGCLLGLLHQRPETHFHYARQVVEIDTLVVAADHQGRGIGRALMHDAEDWARAQGVEEAMLTVWQFNGGAIDFYEQLGYETELLRMSKRL